IYIIAFIFGILIISVRKFYPSLQMVLITILGIITAFGVVSFMGIHVSFMTLLMVPIMIGIGIDGMIHIYHTVQTEKESIIQTEKAVSISLLTTIIAFGSFALAKGGLLKEFGICVSIGLFLSLILPLFVFLPMIERRKEKDV
ncbi:MAG: RND transporter, partial [Thermotogaceae bacterium]|nr:RND transporter [Thermotogaceae bacterium]